MREGGRGEGVVRSSRMREWQSRVSWGTQPTTRFRCRTSTHPHLPPLSTQVEEIRARVENEHKTNPQSRGDYFEHVLHMHS